MTVFLTDENKVIYGMYRWLRQNACDVDIVTLRQICIYIACGNDKFNFSSDCVLNSSNGEYELLLIDGRKILFNNKGFGFKIINGNDNLVMSLNIYESRNGDLSSVSVYGEFISDSDGMYIVSFKNDDLNKDIDKIGMIEYYLNDEKYVDVNLFKILSRSDSEMDCFDGILSEFLVRMDLLYDNFLTFIEKIDKYERVKRI